MTDDLKLIDRYLAGDEYAVEELVIKYQKKIYALAFRMTWNVDDSKDITQKTFMQAFKNIKGFRRASAFYTWLYQIALNNCLNHLKKKGRVTTDLDESFSGSNGNVLSVIIENEEHLLIKNYLKKIPERQKTAIILRAYEGLSLKETAEIMQCSEGAVKAHYHNGMKKLRGMLKEEEHGFQS